MLLGKSPDEQCAGRSDTLFFNILLLVCVIVCTHSAKVFSKPELDLAELLEGFDRPTVQQIRRIPFESIEKATGPIAAPTSSEDMVFQVFAAVIEEIRTSFADYEILVFGRDAEFLFDAMMVTADSSQQKRLHLIQASRGLVKNSRPEDLIAFLEKNGMNIEQILTGRQKVLWLDTGSRGQIFTALFGLLTTQVSESDPQRITKLLNLYENIEGRMIVALGSPSKGEILQYIKGSYRTNAEIASRVRERLFFHHIPSQGRQQLGLGAHFDEEYRWLVDNVEHTPKWRTRTQLVDSDGKVHLLESPKYEGEINRLMHIVLQVKVIKRFLGNRPWLETSEDEPLTVSGVEDGLGEKPLATAQLYAQFEELLSERSRTNDRDRKKAIGEQIGRLLRNHEVAELVLKHRVNSDSFAHVVRRSSEDFPPDFLERYANTIRSLPHPTAKQEKALLKCSQRLARWGSTGD